MTTMTALHSASRTQPAPAYDIERIPVRSVVERLERAVMAQTGAVA